MFSRLTLFEVLLPGSRAASPTAAAGADLSSRLARRHLALLGGGLFVLSALLLSGGADAQGPFDPTTDATGPALSSDLQIVAFNVQNPDNGVNCILEQVTLTAPTDWTVQPSGHSTSAPAWTVDVNGQAVTFSTTVAANRIAEGASKTFRVNVTAPTVPAIESQQWTAAYVATIEGLCTNLVNVPGEDTPAVNLLTLGIGSLDVVEPSGAADLAVSTNQTLKVRANVVNTAAASVANLQVNMSASESNDSAVVTPTFTAASGTTAVQFDFPISAKAAPRTWNLKLVADPVVRHTQLNLTGTAVLEPSINVTKVEIRSGNSTVISGDANATTQRTSIAVTVANGASGSTGRARAIEATAELRLFLDESTGLTDYTSRFANTLSASFTLDSGTNSTLFFDLTPNTCITGDTTSCPPDGDYNVTVVVRYHDENLRHNASTPRLVRSFAFPAKILAVDSSAPRIDRVSDTLQSQPDFRRDGSLTMTVEVSITEPRLNTTAVRLTLQLDGTTLNKTFALTRVGNTDHWTVTQDFAQFETLGAFDVYVNATDTVGNAASQFIKQVNIKDTLPPRIDTLTLTPNTNEILLSETVTIRSSVRDNFRVQDVYARAVHLGSGQDVFQNATLFGAAIPDLGLRMGSAVDCPNGNCTYSITERFPFSGTYRITTFVRDASTNPRSLTRDSSLDGFVLEVTATSDLALFFDDPLGQLAGKNLTADEVPASQTRNATFTNLTLANTGGGQDVFNFRCRVLPGLSNVTGADTAQCLVVDSLDQLRVAPDNVFRVAVFDTTAPNQRDFRSNATGFTLANQAEVQVAVNATTIATAKPGERARIELIGKPLHASAGPGVVLGWEVAKGWGVNVTIAESASSDLFNVRKEIKPTRTETVRFQVRNTGNVDSWFHLAHDPLATTLPNGTTVEWGVAFQDPGGRLQANNSILLRASGATAGADRATIHAIITAPSGLVQSASPFDASLAITAFNATDSANGGTNFSRTVAVELKVRDPSVSLPEFTEGGATIAGWTNRNISMSIQGATPNPCTNTNTANTCPFNATNNTRVTISVFAASTLNRAGDPGFLRVHALVATPCDTSCPGSGGQGVTSEIGRRNMTLNATGGAIQGQNGTYTTTFMLRGEVGTYKVRIWISDFNDQLHSENITFRIAEPVAGSPATCCLQVREGSTQIIRDAAGRYQANQGGDVTVRVAMSDAGAVGRAELRIEKRQEDAPSNIVCDVVPMVRQSSGEQKNGSRLVNATFEGVSGPRSRCNDAPGAFVFRVNAFDAVGNPAGFTANNPFFIDFLDRLGPAIAGELLAGGLNGTLVDAEPTAEVNLTATIRDNGDPPDLRGANVERTGANAPFAEVVRGGQVLQRLDLLPVADSLDLWTATLPSDAIAEPDTYTIRLVAMDKEGNRGATNLTLRIAPNLPPLVTVSSPPERANQRFVSPDNPLVFTINDVNLNLDNADAIVVETRRGNASFERTTAFSVTGAPPAVTVRVNLTGEGAHEVRLTARDSFGEQNSTIALVVVDVTAPTGAQVQVLDLTDENTAGKAFRATLQDPFTVAPDARMFVTANDAGGAVDRVVVTVRPQGGNASNLTLGTPDARFTLQDVLGAAPAEGRYTVSARVEDVVGNAATTPEVTVIVDATPPALGTIVAANPLRVQATDAGAGVRSVRVTWSGTGGASGGFDLQDQGGGTWSGNWPAEAAGQVTFAVRASDQVGNAADGQCAGGTCGFSFGDRAPNLDPLTVTSEGEQVASGGIVRGTVQVSWEGVDPEGLQVRLTLTAQGPSGTVTIAERVTSTQITWDTTVVQDGTYTLRAVATDGTSNSSARTFEVLVRNLVVSAPEPPPQDVAQGQSVLLAFEVGHPSKSVSQVVAVVTAGGGQQSVPLRDDGTQGDRVASDGVWSATFTPRLSGAHNVDLDVSFDDGETMTVSNVAGFTAQGALQALSMAVVGAALAVAVVVVALGAFGAWRWR